MEKQSWMSLRFFTFFFTWGVFIPYWTAWLTTKGFSIEDAGLFVAVGLIVRAIATFYIFPALCRRFPLSSLFKWVPLISTVVLLGFIPFDRVEILMAVTVIFALTYPILLPMNETMATLLARDHQLDYGKSRLWGSVGYIAALVLTGWLTSRYGDTLIVYIMLASCAVLSLQAFAGEAKTVQSRQEQAKAPLMDLFKSPAFVICLAICMLIQGAHAAYNGFGVVYLQQLKVDNTLIGWIMVLAVISEIAFFYLSKRFFTNMSVPVMFTIAAISSVIRWLAVYLFHDVTVFLLSQTMHSMTFGLTHFAFIKFVNEHLPGDTIAPAQGVYSALAMSLFPGILTVACGYLYAFSSHLPFLGMALVSFPCLFLCYMLQKRLAGMQMNSSFQQGAGAVARAKP
ncbi:3-phenylpropionate MFS transporter [Lihuaxuella thermophila]|uniref:MFS transporter, PPP family, 3-phenylpropionic acid transporter n=1 Tax=Lihuaxuella thermophila TaxID=1173111 RepID=A0A1H8H6B5_9BACL|nr:3-phenylpropionate MFS transporter [Lihuaxuella thermophila]SEN51550.1 MFS transporter, PPP family, 3-phenylpropionic acid transporter [Lihuaxuella thermophila]